MLNFRESRAALEQSSDPIFIALRAEQAARRAHAEALHALEEAGAFSGRPNPQAEMGWRAHYLEKLEVREMISGDRLTASELFVLHTKPTSLEGGAALLRFLLNYMDDNPKLAPIRHAVGNVEATLLELLANS